jgi:hypothetical protein
VIRWIAAVFLVDFVALAAGPVAGEGVMIDFWIRAGTASGHARVPVELRMAGGITPEGELPAREPVVRVRPYTRDMLVVRHGESVQ